MDHKFYWLDKIDKAVLLTIVLILCSAAFIVSIINPDSVEPASATEPVLLEVVESKPPEVPTDAKVDIEIKQEEVVEEIIEVEEPKTYYRRGLFFRRPLFGR